METPTPLIWTRIGRPRRPRTATASPTPTSHSQTGTAAKPTGLSERPFASSVQTLSPVQTSPSVTGPCGPSPATSSSTCAKAPTATGFVCKVVTAMSHPMRRPRRRRRQRPVDIRRRRWRRTCRIRSVRQRVSRFQLFRRVSFLDRLLSASWRVALS
jgi:hypothetical protein